jgi:hypothetical protein
MLMELECSEIQSQILVTWVWDGAGTPEPQIECRSALIITLVTP